MPTHAEENSSPENRELARVLWELARLSERSTPVDGQELRQRYRQILRGVIAESSKSRKLTDLLDGAEYFVGGDEHHLIRVDSEPDRVYKVTHGDNFGCRSRFSPKDPELLGHFHGETNDDPIVYLERWLLLNAIGEFQTRFEGFVPAENPGWIPRICVSQPELPAEIASGRILEWCRYRCNESN